MKTTADRLAAMSTDELNELDARLEEAAWKLVGRPAHDKRWQAVEEAIGLVEDELEARGEL